VPSKLKLVSAVATSITPQNARSTMLRAEEEQGAIMVMIITMKIFRKIMASSDQMMGSISKLVLRRTVDQVQMPTKQI
jgi:hypothetical protein